MKIRTTRISSDGIHRNSKNNLPLVLVNLLPKFSLVNILRIWIHVLILSQLHVSAVSSSSNTNPTVAIFLPYSTNSIPDESFNETVDAAISAASRFDSQSRSQISTQVYRTNKFSSLDLQDIVQVLDDKIAGKVHAIVGPPYVVLCDSLAGLATQYNVLTTSYLCTDSLFRSRQNYATLVNVVPNDRVTVRALSAFLRHFQWRFCVVITSDDQNYFQMDQSIDYVLATYQEFDVLHHYSIPDDVGHDRLVQVLQSIGSNVKAIILLLPLNVTRTVLLAAQGLGMTSGDFAFILIDTFDPVRMFPNTSMINPLDWGVIGKPGENVTQDNEQYLETLMILKTHSYPIVNSNLNFTEQQSNLHEYLYNAVSLTYSILQNGLQNGADLSNGRSLTSSAANLTFSSFQGRMSIGSDENITFFFSLWDYNKKQGLFYPSLEVQNFSDNAYENILHPVAWPNGRAPSPDNCYFTSCKNTTLIVIVIVVSVIFVLLATVASVFLIFIRRRLLYKELTHGPNKIIIGFDDVVFVAARSVSMSKASLSSKSIRDRPLNNARKPSDARSLTSLQTLHGDKRSNIARYNGDLVFMKELFIKGFEIHGKTRTYLKSLRDLRNDNLNPFIGCFVDPVRPAFVFEYCSRRSLEDVISNSDIKLDWEFKLSLLTDLVLGMRYLHGSAIKQHGWLKSRNCVIDSRWVLKVTDFGVKGIYERFQNIQTCSPTELLWTAPELLRSDELFQKGSQKADVYSYSIIMQELIVRGPPFSMLDRSADEIIQKIRRPPPLCRPSVSPGAAPPEFIQIMKQCWSEQPDMRPDFDDISSRFKSLNRGKKVNIVDTMFKMLEKYSNDLEEVVRVRTVALEEERKKTENLLRQMLPISVAHALLSGSTVDPEWYDDVTIYFSDIVGFTTISAMSTPLQVVELLNDLYTTFDSTIDDYDVYKVETIGDAYMVCSGLPVRNRDHAGQIGTLALDILSECGQFRIQHMPDLPLRIRIGLHSGSCVAGVVGLRMPRYCLFGDTVNTASRMESTGSAFRIHISQTTKDELDSLKGGYQIQLRGEVELKGKGMHKTYWLVGKGGFHKPLPEPPAQTGEDNHGLGAYIVPSTITLPADDHHTGVKPHTTPNGTVSKA